MASIAWQFYSRIACFCTKNEMSHSEPNLLVPSARSMPQPCILTGSNMHTAIVRLSIYTIYIYCTDVSCWTDGKSAAFEDNNPLLQSLEALKSITASKPHLYIFQFTVRKIPGKKRQALDVEDSAGRFSASSWAELKRSDQLITICFSSPNGNQWKSVHRQLRVGRFISNIFAGLSALQRLQIYRTWQDTGGYSISMNLKCCWSAFNGFHGRVAYPQSGKALVRLDTAVAWSPLALVLVQYSCLYVLVWSLLLPWLCRFKRFKYASFDQNSSSFRKVTGGRIPHRLTSSAVPWMTSSYCQMPCCLLVCLCSLIVCRGFWVFFAAEPLYQPIMSCGAKKDPTAVGRRSLPSSNQSNQQLVSWPDPNIAHLERINHNLAALFAARWVQMTGLACDLPSFVEGVLFHWESLGRSGCSKSDSNVLAGLWMPGRSIPWRECLKHAPREDQPGSANPGEQNADMNPCAAKPLCNAVSRQWIHATKYVDVDKGCHLANCVVWCSDSCRGANWRLRGQTSAKLLAGLSPSDWIFQ